MGAAVVLAALLPLERLKENVNFQAPSLVLWMADGITGLWPLTLIPLAAAAVLVVLGRGNRSRVGCWASSESSSRPRRSPPTGRCRSRAVRRARSESAKTHAGSITPCRSDADVLALWVVARRGGGLRTRDAGRLDERVLQPLGRKGRRGRHADAVRPAARRRGDRRWSSARDSEDAAITAPYVLAPCWVAVDGQVVASDPQVAARVYRVASGPIRIRRHVAEAACTTAGTGEAMAAGSRRHR